TKGGGPGGTTSASPDRKFRKAPKARARRLQGTPSGPGAESWSRAFNRIEKQRAAQLFSVAAENWLAGKKAHLAPRSVVIERANLKHLNPFFGKMLVCDIRGEDVARYQAARLEEQAAPKTVNLDVGTLRAVLRKNRLLFAI